MRKHKEIQETQGVEQKDEERVEEEVVLTRRDRAGNIRPVEITTRPEPSGGRRKRKKVFSFTSTG